MITSIKIGGLEYSISYSDKLFGKDNEKLSGRMLSEKQEILLSDNLHEQQAESTLLHEILHVIAYMSGIDAPENAVMAFESGIYQVLVDNPEFIEMFRIRSHK